MSDLEDLEELYSSNWIDPRHQRRGRARSLADTCKHGHPMTPENTGLQKQNGYLKRSCKECARIYAREQYARQRAARTSPAPPR